MSYALVERFVSINGEGPKAGQLALFLRFPGCNLQCSYCDTAWANADSAPREWLSLAALSACVLRAGVSQVTITGGEPLMRNDMSRLLSTLSGLPNIQVEVETNGSIPLDPFLAAAPAVSFTMDYKLPSSGMESRMHLENLHLLRPTDSLKFVCGSRSDLIRAAALVQEYKLQTRTMVFLSPVFGQIEPLEMVEFMKAEGLSGLRLQLQLHKFIWPPEERGV